MRVEHTFCDRCNREITSKENRCTTSLVGLGISKGQIDLCTDCFGGLVRWLHPVENMKSLVVRER